MPDWSTLLMRNDLAEAAIRSDNEVIVNLMARPSFDVNSREAREALVGAAERGDFLTVRLLMESGANIDAGTELG